MTDKTLVIIDGSYYLFRAYHALPSFTNASGEPTGAIYGVMNMLKKAQELFQPDYFAVVFDAKGTSFRNTMYAGYKAHRPPAPDDLICQIQAVHDIIDANGIPRLVIDDVEADDVLGTLAVQACEKDIKTIMCSGDKDLCQVINDKIHMYNSMQDRLFDPAGVLEKFEVRTDQIIDYLALIGDKVDNVPGVPKVGPKTAVKWLNLYNNVDGVIEHADEIKGKVGESLREHIEQLKLSRELVTLKTDVELDFGPEDLLLKSPDHQQLKQLYTRWQFRSWLIQLERAEEAQAESFDEIVEQEVQPSVEKNYQTILDNNEFEAWLKRLQEAELFAFDTETNSLNYMSAEIVGVSFAIVAGEAAYVPCAHQYDGAPEQLGRDFVLGALKPLLESPKHKKLGHHLKYDKHVLKNHGIDLQGVAHDSMLESYVLNSTASRHDMDSLALLYLNHTTTHYEDVAGKGAKQITFDKVELDKAGPYAAEDADITLQLHQNLSRELNKHSGLQKLYSELEVPLSQVLCKIEDNGVLVDEFMLNRQSEELQQGMDTIKAEAVELVGEDFNIDSPKQIQAILFEKMQLPVISKTAKGQPSTAESVLQELAHEHELPALILKHRSLSKLKSTYTDKLPLQIHPKTGRVHTSYHQAVAATGRLSSSDPNLQNIPIRTAEGRRIREAFIAPEGYKILAADYSQIELRIMAHLSGDNGLLTAFAEGKDIHRSTAAEVFACNEDAVSQEQRRAAKAINFGLIYGMSAFGLAKQLGISRKEAQEYVDLYFSYYPGVKQYMEEIRLKAREQGYVETVFQRRLYLPEINARNAMRRQYAERTAINAPMQGTAADIIKRAMLATDLWLQQEKVPARIIMQVHDELVLEVKEGELDSVTARLKELMITAAELDVPLDVDVGIGENWDQAH